MYFIDESLYHKIIQNIELAKTRFLTKASIDSVNYHVFTNKNMGRVTPSFKKIENVKYGSRSNDTLVLPVGNSFSDIMMIIEFKTMTEVEQAHSRITESKNENTSGTSEIDDFDMNLNAKQISIVKGGFNVLDEFTFKILLEFIKKRVEIITSKKDALVKKKTGGNLINLCGGIMKVSTLTK